LANLGNPSNVLEADEARAAARTLGLEVATSDVRRAEDITPAFEALKNGTQALYVCPIRSLPSPKFASTPWRSAHDCRRSTAFAETSHREV
jgi:hypothetical protein